MVFSRYFIHLLHDGDLRVHWMTASSSGPFLYSVSAAAAATTTVGVGEAYLFQSPLGLAPLHTGCERNYTPKSLYPLHNNLSKKHILGLNTLKSYFVCSSD